MTDGHVSYFERYHPEYLPKIHNLNIDDIWGNCNAPQLKEMLFKKVKRFLNQFGIDERLDDFDYQSIHVKPIEEYVLSGLKEFWFENE